MAIQFGKIFFRVSDWVHCFSSCSWSQVLFQYSSFNIQYFCILNELSSCDHKGTCFPVLRRERRIPEKYWQYVKRNAKYLKWKKNMKSELCWSDLFRRTTWTRHRRSFCLMVMGYVLLTFRKGLVWVGDDSNKGWGKIYESERKISSMGDSVFGVWKYAAFVGSNAVLMEKWLISWELQGTSLVQRRMMMGNVKYFSVFVRIMWDLSKSWICEINGELVAQGKD